jgi:hypothetical protein
LRWLESVEDDLKNMSVRKYSVTRPRRVEVMPEKEQEEYSNVLVISLFVWLI